MLKLRTTSLGSKDCAWSQSTPYKNVTVGARWIRVSSEGKREKQKPQIKTKGWSDTISQHVRPADQRTRFRLVFPSLEIFGEPRNPTAQTVERNFVEVSSILHLAQIQT